VSAASRRALAAAAVDGNPERARHLAAVAEAHLREDRPGEAARSARSALAAVGAGDPATEGAATVTLAAALADLDDAESGIALLRTARRAAAERRDLATLGRAVACLADRYLPHLDEPAAWYAFDEAMATATRFGLEHETGPTIAAGVRLALRVGDAARARELISARLPLEPDPGLRAWLSATAGLLAVEADDPALAGELASRAESEAVGSPALAALRVALGAPLASYVRDVPVGFDRRNPLPLTIAARCALAEGDPPAVSAVVADRLDGTALAQVRCAVLAAEGDDEAAVAAGGQALSAGRRVAAWLDADTHLAVGRCLVRLGRIDEAGTHRERAIALLARWPGRLRAAAESLGRSVASSGGSSGPLTAREAEVLSCLAAGMSNKQVARSLGISVRTVTVHVSNLLRKTGSASRTEAALWAVRHLPGA
jgi:DNA-binding CsgD family transcriptional regulator